jgi:RNA polymerase sigma-70 factor (ECF subfamily)
MGDPIESDADLIERARGGAADAFVALIARYKGITASAVFSLIPDAREADEVCEDAFVEAWQRLASLRSAAAFGAWVRKIARHLALRHIRARTRERARRAGQDGGRTALAEPATTAGPPEDRRPARASAPVPIEEIPAPATADPSEQFAIRDLYERISLELARLPRPYREALGMRYFGGLACKEIAAALGLPIGTVTMQLSRGSRLLRARLGAKLRDYLEG